MSRPLKILDFDLECLPGHWIGGDYVSKIITAAAWSWVGEDEVQVVTHYDESDIASLVADKIEKADIVTGHYIRGFDLPLLNGGLLRERYVSLADVMTSDTKLDLKKAHGRSKSQKNLAAELGVKANKVDMTLYEWEMFNTRQPGGRDKGVERVRGDVIQHKALRAVLLAIGWLGPPKRWSAKSAGSNGEYRP